MADLGRKDYTEQAKDAITPDSQKSTLDKTKDTVTGKADDVARALQPEGQKSTTQKMGDSTKDTFDQGTEQGQSLLGKAQEAISNTAQSISDTISGNKK